MNENVTVVDLSELESIEKSALNSVAPGGGICGNICGGDCGVICGVICF